MPLRRPPWYVLLSVALIAGPVVALPVVARLLLGPFGQPSVPPAWVDVFLASFAWGCAATLLLGLLWLSWGVPFFAAADRLAIAIRAPREVFRSMRNWTFLPCVLLVVAAGVFLVPLFVEGASAEGKRTMALVSLVLLVIAIPVGAAGGWWSARLRRRIQRNARARNLCYACGYDLRGNPEAPCPECVYSDTAAR